MLNRAFDLSRSPSESLEIARGLGFSAVLTSGQAQSAEAGKPLLEELVRRADGKIEIMAGGGVTSANVAELHRATGVTAFHASAKRRAESGMRFRREGVSMGFGQISEYAKFSADEREIEALKREIESFGDRI